MSPQRFTAGKTERTRRSPAERQQGAQVCYLRQKPRRFSAAGQDRWQATTARERRLPALRPQSVACDYLESRPERCVSSDGACKSQNEGGCEECVEYLFHTLYSEE
jgi:hypothetical protein